MNEEEAIRICKKIIKQNNEIVKQTRKNKDINAMQLTANCDKESIAIETVLNLLENKDKMIDLMGEKIFEEGIVWENKEDVKQYYERKVEG